MLDAAARRIIDPPLDAAGRALAARGIGADAVTLGGLALGLVAAGVIAAGHPGWALVPLLASRLLDGLDGAVARGTRRTDFGGFLDILCDYVFYGAIPLAFAVMDPALALPAATLIFAFFVNGASFLALAIMAAKRGIQSERQGLKSLHYSSGLVEGTETIALFVLACLVPAWFAPAAYAFAALCLFTAAMRALYARHMLNGH